MNVVRKVIQSNYAEEFGITGKGIGVAILDTGIYLHRDFADRVIAFQDFLNYRTAPYDDNSHGTHVAGIIAGTGVASHGRYRGIAPQSNIISVKVLDDKGNGDTETVLGALKWVIEKKEEYGIRIVNISVGTLPKCKDEDTSCLVEAVEQVWDTGMVVVVAAGNNGPDPYTITTPGISKKVITVGSTDDNSIKDFFGRMKVNYSGRGPTQACVCKPEIVAPGLRVTSCNAPQGYNHKVYTTKSGTSMSTPIVAGAIALLLEKQPHLKNVEVKMKLKDSCKDLGLPRNRQGWGQIDIEKLLK